MTNGHKREANTQANTQANIQGEAKQLRAGEVTLADPPTADASVVFIGRIHTPWTQRSECPRQGRHDGPLCQLELFDDWAPALLEIERYARLEVLYWLDQSRRDLLVQNPADDGSLRGTFSLRSPVRPNPIGTALVVLESIDGAVMSVRGLDCLCGTPLIDIKPDRCLYSPLAPEKHPLEKLPREKHSPKKHPTGP